MLHCIRSSSYVERPTRTISHQNKNHFQSDRHPWGLRLWLVRVKTSLWQKKLFSDFVLMEFHSVRAAGIFFKSHFFPFSCSNFRFRAQRYSFSFLFPSKFRIKFPFSSTVIPARHNFAPAWSPQSPNTAFLDAKKKSTTPNTIVAHNFILQEMNTTMSWRKIGF